MNARKYPNQRGISLIFVFLATFFAMFAMGSFLFQNFTKVSITPTPQPLLGNSIKFFLVVVDDLNAATPKMVSLWTISIDKNLNQIYFLEMADSPYWNTLADTFSIESDLSLQQEFIQTANSIVPDAQGYILIDQFGANSVFAAYSSEQSLVNKEGLIERGQIEAYCMALNQSDFSLQQGIGYLIEEQHLLSKINPEVSVNLWEIFVLPQQQRTCSINASAAK